MRIDSDFTREIPIYWNDNSKKGGRFTLILHVIC